jgi:excisionase family DNA binding protein
MQQSPGSFQFPRRRFRWGGLLALFGRRAVASATIRAYTAAMKLDLLTVAQAADKIGVMRQQVYKWIYAGRMPVVEIAGRQFIERRYARRPPAKKPGPEPSRKSISGKG